MAPMTPEQLKFFSEQTERAVHLATKRVVRRATAGFMILLLGLGGQYYVGQQDLSARREVAQQQRSTIVKTGNAVAVAGCNRDFATTKVLRGLLSSAQAQTDAAFKRGDITAAQLARSKNFYTTQLGLLVLPDCRPVAHFVSADPTKDVVVPTPLYEVAK